MLDPSTDTDRTLGLVVACGSGGVGGWAGRVLSWALWGGCPGEAGRVGICGKQLGFTGFGVEGFYPGHPWGFGVSTRTNTKTHTIIPILIPLLKLVLQLVLDPSTDTDRTLGLVVACGSGGVGGWAGRVLSWALWGGCPGEAGRVGICGKQLGFTGFGVGPEWVLSRAPLGIWGLY